MLRSITRHKRKISLALLGFVLLALLVMFAYKVAWAQDERMPTIKLPDITIGEKEGKPQEMSRIIHIIAGLTVLSMAPYILIMTTSFIRVTIVLSFVKTALGTQQVPPQQVMMGLALFITFYIMAPVFEEMRSTAMIPFYKGELNSDEFRGKLMVPLRKFLLSQTRDKDLLLFVKLARKTPSEFSDRTKVPFHIILPAFIVSEVKTAFEIGFVIYLPFLVIDMVVASVLMSMGMFMLSPMQISMPFKLLLFVMIDGWNVIVENLVKSFKMP